MKSTTQKQTWFTVADFMKKFPSDDACLEHVFQLRYGGLEACPKCAVIGAKFYRMKKRRCYACGQCGGHIYPLAGTPMHESTTNLTSWFFAIYLFASSKNGVSAKELQRQLGVTYKTAWRMGHKIRELMGRDDTKLGGGEGGGAVEVDESLIGGRAKGKRGWGAGNKTCLFGIIEKGGAGRVRVTVVGHRKRRILIPLIQRHVEPGTTVHSDEFRVYRSLPLNGFKHESVCHSKYQWKNGECHTNNIEGYWSNLKKSLRGTHTFVSQKHLQAYINEFDFRHNHRGSPMFDAMIGKFT